MARRPPVPTITCEFRVPGDPVAQPRFGMIPFRKKGTNKLGVRPAKEPDHPVHAFRQEVLARFLEARPKGWLSGKADPAGYRVLALLFRPRRTDLPKKLPGPVTCTTKPDADNVLKAIKDALKGAAWYDDGRVYDERAIKMWSAEGNAPQTVVIIQQTPIFEVSVNGMALTIHEFENRRVL